ncbi:acetate kinase [Mucilaginibacter gracilis]|uniref:Acetate kinase n=1 Tax=Mucilaginibacter gracilis TaxID=423350 RepID=A0A495J1L1_9SPHI|nr:acetate/propionate family kinase [Mucilaginibacter gracilis]RKR81979.1 acetate kinase [Mucilaginibacter gracilis]
MENRSYILAMNCGSSGIKFSLFSSDKLEAELTGSVELADTAESHFNITSRNGMVLVNYPIAHQDIHTAVKEIVSWFHLNRQHYPLSAIGHRIVQGGPEHRRPCVIDADLLNSLQHWAYLAPNHLPDDIKVIKAFRKQFPDALHVACFDTFFHRDMPDVAKYYALPSLYRDKGLIRYGFHGISCEYIMNKLGTISPAITQKKVIVAHLGNGSSITAIQNGQSVETTMGISPSGGILMGTRAGDIDPGVTLFLLKHENLTVTELDDLLSKHAGLKALAGHSNMELLLAKEENDTRSEEAVKAFCYQARKAIGALTAALGGLDVLVFTGGIGQHSARIRELICEPLDFLGINLNPKANHQNRVLISAKGAKAKVYALATHEEQIIASHTKQLLQQQTITDHDRTNH